MLYFDVSKIFCLNTLFSENNSAYNIKYIKIFIGFYIYWKNNRRIQNFYLKFQFVQMGNIFRDFLNNYKYKYKSKLKKECKQN